jgi:arylsulfatase
VSSAFVIAICARALAAGGGIDRTVLPVLDAEVPTITELDARNAKAPPRFEVKAPKGAPNVVIVLLDDIGFGQSSAFGGPAKMATLDKLASAGLRYNDFHTTALCSPTRTALLTGRNHHVNNAGAIMELATGFPGNTGIRPQSVAPLAEMLRLNGYSTAAFGKYHETPPWEVSVSGPVRSLAHAFRLRQVLRLHRRRDQPVGARHLRRHRAGRSPPRPRLPLHRRHDRPRDRLDPGAAVADARTSRSSSTSRPGALHAPHHVPKPYIDRYKGQFDSGLGQAARRDLRAPEEDGRDPARARS